MLILIFIFQYNSITLQSVSELPTLNRYRLLTQIRFMQMDNYTHFQLGKKHHALNATVLKHFESVLLWLLAATGVIGSVFLISQHVSQPGDGGKFPESASVSSMLAGIDTEEQATADFDSYVKMTSKAKVGEVIEIEFLQDESASRYVMEMGNGERLIVTQKDLIYTYDQPGKYVVELKEIRRGLLRLVGTKRIKVK